MSEIPILDSAELDQKLTELDNKYYTDKEYPSKVNYFNVHRPRSLVLKFQERFKLFNSEEIVDIVTTDLNETPEKVELMTNQGTGHILTLVTTKGYGDLVVRINHGLPFTETYMELEKDFLEIYRDLGVPVNNLLYSNITRSRYDFDYQIIEKLAGRNLGSEWEGSKEDYEKICVEQGRYIAKMHGKLARGWGRVKKDDFGIYGVMRSHNDFLTAYLDHDLDVLLLHGIINKSDLNTILTFFKSNNVVSLFSDTKPHLIHNDPSDLNMTYIDNRFGCYFDFENLAAFDPLNEIATAPTWKSAYEKREKMLEGYIKELGIAPHNLYEKMSVYKLRKVLDKVAFALKGKRLSLRHLNLLTESLNENRLKVEMSAIESLKSTL